MMLEIEHLKKGDLIEIIAPAKAIEKEHVEFAKDYLEKSGFTVNISENCLGQYNYFSGSIKNRLSDLQNAIDNPEVKAILCARGGYGCVQIVDKADWSTFATNPKWVIGFSDVTVFHQHLQKLNIPSLHGTMPLNFKTNSPESLETLIHSLKGEPYSISQENSKYNQHGEAEGELIGGNLSILFSLLGTNSQPSYKDKILFIEDLSEHIYHIDRMFHAMEKSNILNEIKGLVIGGMTDLKDTQIPYGSPYEEVICSHFSSKNIPICFNFQAGHIDDNRALVLGGKVSFVVNEDGAKITFKG